MSSLLSIAAYRMQLSKRKNVQQAGKSCYHSKQHLYFHLKYAFKF